MALKEIEKGKFLAVIYKESKPTGFIITAYFTTKIKIKKKVVLWAKES